MFGLWHCFAINRTRIHFRQRYGHDKEIICYFINFIVTIVSKSEFSEFTILRVFNSQHDEQYLKFKYCTTFMRLHYIVLTALYILFIIYRQLRYQHSKWAYCLMSMIVHHEHNKSRKRIIFLVLSRGRTMIVKCDSYSCDRGFRKIVSFEKNVMLGIFFTK